MMPDMPVTPDELMQVRKDIIEETTLRANVRGKARNGTTTFNLSGAWYVSYEWRAEEGGVNYTHDADGKPYPVRQHGLGQIEIRPVGKCDHMHTICAGRDADDKGWCADSWMLDHVIFFDRTEGGRRLSQELPWNVVAHERNLNSLFQLGQPYIFIRPGEELKVNTGPAHIECPHCGHSIMLPQK